MTDQRTFSDVRTTRAHSNGHGYTVSIDRFAWPGDPDNVHWLTELPKSKRVTTGTRHGVLLRGYHVTKDDHPAWAAELETAPGPDGRLRLVAATVTGDDLSSTALPVVPLLQACLRVGGVVSQWERFPLSQTGRDGKRLTGWRESMGAPPRDAHGDLFDDDQVSALTGERPRRARGYRQDPDLLRRVWDAVCEHDRLKNERLAAGLTVRGKNGMPDQRLFVAKRCGLPKSNVQKQITAARRKYENTNKGDRQ